MRVALVAGATRGAGRAIAVELARAGFFVYATGRSSRVSGPSELDRSETIEETGELIRAVDQRWTLGRIKALIGKLFHVGYTIEGTWKLMRRHGWSCQVPVRQAMERDERAIAVWKAEVCRS
jgi:NAD(P)-dependent dehydrogenase (short-subunit alcohol dehydrogenase family)